MSAWLEFAAASLAFYLSHAIPSRRGLRTALTNALGERTYLVIYITLSIGLLAWMIAAAGRAPYVPLWDYAPWQSWLPNIVMPFVCLLAAFGAAAPNPLSFGGWNTQAFDPDHPGIAGITRHPILWAIALWAGAHAIPNGNLAHVILFGGFTALALAGMIAIDRRLQRKLGLQEWRRLAQRTSQLPLGALIRGRWRPKLIAVNGKRVLIALVVYVIFLTSHASIIGVSPLPAF